MQFFKRYEIYILLILLVAFSGILRFYKLDWGEGLYSHPDEYHIVSAVNQLSYPSQMHPHFFSYGTVTIYLIYFTQELLKSASSVLSSQFIVPSSFLIGRFYSALFSTLTILLIYKISRVLMNKRFSYLAAFFVVLTPGLIQQAHFATPESALIFFLFLSLFFMMKFIRYNIILYLVSTSIALGFSLGVKISSIVFLFPLTVAILLKSYSRNSSRLKSTFRSILKFIGLILISLIVAVVTFALVAQYVFLDYQAFKSNLDYEGGLAIGKISVFYTRQFIDTAPVLFQFEKIFPYALGPSLFIFGVLGFIHLVIKAIKILYHSSVSPHTSSREVSNETMKQFNNKTIYVLLIVAFLSLFIPSAFLFAKWTRFIAPTFPFFSIFAAYFLYELTNKMKVFTYLATAIIILFTMLWAMAFFSVYTNPDIRITASKWLESHVKPDSNFLVEGGNTVDLPLHGNFQRTSIDFYALEENSSIREKVVDALYSSDYFLVQSRRIFYNHQRLRNLYPKTARFYDALFNGQLGFEQIEEFHSYPKLSLFGFNIEFPDEGAEETWSVFDHPVIRTFEKKKQLNREEYARFLEI
ncbi:MAG: glycosyltransferase family 39 protein [Candidatus Levybacteria bacterium]|nr:glycosyltransferase family 39 protein [Candidatus Levybacteria bacterium]